MTTYQIINDPKTQTVACILKDGHTSIPLSTDNTDYQQYLKWLEEGNQVLPAEEQQ